MKKVILAVAAIVLISGTVSADWKVFGNYGILLSPEYVKAGVAGEVLTTGGLGYGLQMGPGPSSNFGIGIEFAMLPIFNDKYSTTLLGVPITMESGLNVVPVLLYAQLGFPLAPDTTLYIQGGGGAMLTWTTATVLGVSGSSFALKTGFMGCAGLGIKLAPMASISAEVKVYYIMTDVAHVLLSPGASFSISLL